MAKLTSLRLAGWKSIREARIEFRPLNVLIGANGAGKSNLVSFFKLLQEMTQQRLQIYVGMTGGADSFVHYGWRRTPAIEAELQLAADLGVIDYSFQLIPVSGNTLIFGEERLAFYHWTAPPLQAQNVKIRSERGHRESMLEVLHDSENPSTDFDRSGEALRAWRSRCQVFHFHDTSLLAPIRRDCAVDANRFLAADGANLPAMLYLYRERYATAYKRIVAAVRAVAPFFDDFVLEPLRLNPRNIALHWRAQAPDPDFGTGSGSGISDYEFGPHQLSDGTLRAVALFTLLLQPEQDLPALIVLDEPELGLHPAALAVLADLIKSAAQHTQLVIATQSATLIDQFDADDIVTVNLRDGNSTFERLDAARLKEWLAEYTLSELWERNVIGGGPY